MSNGTTKRSSSGTSASHSFFEGNSETARRCRDVDWSATPLGAPALWPTALKVATGIVLASPTGMILLWGSDLVQIYNDEYSTVMGNKHPAGLGQRNKECWPEVWDFTGPIYDGVLQRRESFSFVDQRLVLKRPGKPAEGFFTLSYSPIDDGEGAVGGILVTVTETTANVHARALESERARLAYALELAPTQVLEDVFRKAPSFLAVYRGPEHTYALVNDAYYQLIGHGREIIGKPLLEALPEVRGQGFDSLLDGVLLTGQPFVAREIPVRLERTPGEPQEDRVVALTYLPLSNADGHRIGVVAHGTDVTEYVRAREQVEQLLAETNETRRHELEEANAQLTYQSEQLADANRLLELQALELEERTHAAEAGNRAKAEFLAVMSHELRTPLNAISGYAQLLELGIHGPVTKEQLGALDRIQRGQQHLLGLINTILNYAKLEAGHVAYQVENVPMLEMMTSMASLTMPLGRVKDIEIVVQSCPADLVARADAEKVRQVLLNLISNAVKFTMTGGMITIACKAVAEEKLAVRVADTGGGIPPEHLERVFQPFVQVDSQLTRQQQGTGLGLAISRDLARGMGGELSAESTVGVGSAFVLTLQAASA